jgi:hypothetical protein
MEFAQNFDGFEYVVGKRLMHVNEHSIAKSYRFQVWGKMVEEGECGHGFWKLVSNSREEKP